MSLPRILIIEGNEKIAYGYKSVLDSAGYEAITAFSGEEGVSLFQDLQPEMVIINLSLPDMLGAQVLREIRLLSVKAPAIMIAADVSPRLYQQCDRLGVQQYLHQPINNKELVAAVGRALQTQVEEAEIIIMRIPTRIIDQLNKLNLSLEYALGELIDKEFCKTA